MYTSTIMDKYNLKYRTCMMMYEYIYSLSVIVSHCTKFEQSQPFNNNKVLDFGEVCTI